MIKDTLKDFIATTLQVSDSPYDEETIENMPTHNYEFPNGHNQFYAQERFRIPEGLFDPSMIKVGWFWVKLETVIEENNVVVQGHRWNSTFAEEFAAICQIPASLP